MKVYIVVKKHWYRDDIGWHSDLCEIVKVFRKQSDAGMCAYNLNEQLRASAKPYEDLYDHYRFDVEEEVVE